VIVTTSARALRDSFPISNGHTLVIPRRHVPSIFELSEEERSDVWRVVTEVRRQLQNELRPAAFNIGVNDGRAAGQTVLHAHVHVIPRYDDGFILPEVGSWAAEKHSKIGYYAALFASSMTFSA
jgi:diadenosine tetraphosphate (Ap4A) HIT family hydrolase